MQTMSVMSVPNTYAVSYMAKNGVPLFDVDEVDNRGL